MGGGERGPLLSGAVFAGDRIFVLGSLNIQDFAVVDVVAVNKRLQD